MPLQKQRKEIFSDCIVYFITHHWYVVYIGLYMGGVVYIHTYYYVKFAIQLYRDRVIVVIRPAGLVVQQTSAKRHFLERITVMVLRLQTFWQSYEMVRDHSFNTVTDIYHYCKQR